MPSERRQRAGVADRVTFLGTVGDDDLIGLYARRAGGVYPPFDEDFGYVTLEAFLARKPVDHLHATRAARTSSSSTA